MCCLKNGMPERTNTENEARVRAKTVFVGKSSEHIVCEYTSKHCCQKKIVEERLN